MDSIAMTDQYSSHNHTHQLWVEQFDHLCSAMSNFGFAILLVLGCNTIGRGQTFKSETDLNLVFERAEITGAAMAVITPDKPADFHYYGAKNVETNDPIDRETIFEVASLSKPVFAQLVTLLAKKE